MGFVDHNPKELLPSNYQELPLGGDRSSRRRKVFRKITLLLTFVLLLGLVLKDVTFVQEKYAAFSQVCLSVFNFLSRTDPKFMNRVLTRSRKAGTGQFLTTFVY